MFILNNMKTTTKTNQKSRERERERESERERERERDFVVVVALLFSVIRDMSRDGNVTEVAVCIVRWCFCFCLFRRCSSECRMGMLFSGVSVSVL